MQSNTLNGIAAEVHSLAKTKGWWPELKAVELPDDKPDVGSVSRALLMMHSEISEAVEDLRVAKFNYQLNEIQYEGGTEQDADGSLKPIGFAVEIADLVIRALDLAERTGIDLEHVIAVKHAYNKTRSQRHGGKAL
jgi:hypothetical protein